MGYRVKNELEISVLVNGAEYPLDAINAFNFLHCAESTKYHVPTFHIAILDVMGVMDKFGLGDASKLKMVIKDSGSMQVMNFRVGSWLRHPSGGYNLYEIDGFLDAPRYRIGTSSLGINGTSSTALQEIATLCELDFSGIQTNDAQVWLPRNMSYSNFAAYIAGRGFISAHSHLAMFVDLTGTMRYRDVRAPSLTARVTHGYSAAKAYQAQEFKPVTSSGLTNAVSGYRDTRISQSAYGGSSQDSLSVTSQSKNLMLNNEVRDLIKRGNHTYSPVDFGNVHSNFEKAKYQNARYDALLSLGGEFVFDHPTNLHCLDTIALTTHATKSSEYDGNYVISHKVIYVQGTSYAEKIIAMREGMN